MTNQDERSPAENFDIAVIGMTGRFPGSSNIDTFWQNLAAGVESIKTFSDEELHAAAIDAALLQKPNVVKAGAHIEGVDLFDAGFFGYSPREAELMDPQQRIFLECAWEALEHAGYDPESYKMPIGLYAGIGTNTYLLKILSALQSMENADGLQVTIGNDKDYLTTRASYKLNLTGPSVTVQTACSTTLVAIHLACQGLLAYECDMALAGGVSIRAPQPMTYIYQEGGILSPDGHCRAFDEQANGTVFGNGIGIVVLKRLQDALDDGDTIHAVIKSSAINNDGSAKVGYTAPSLDGQVAVIKNALRLGGVKPETISYIEAHGTGTTLGDPIEIAALTKIFRASTSKQQFCALGSVKTNVGHLDTAAGVTGFIKTVLALKHRQIPPSLHFEQPNPEIDFAQSPFYVNTRLTEWPAGSTPRRAGVSSFGIGGTNAHVILEEAPVVEVTDAAQPWQLLLLSARSAAALETATGNLARYLEAHPNENLADIAFTTQLGRRGFAYRRMLVCRDMDDAIATLKSGEPTRLLSAVHGTNKRPIAFMFTGQGAQYAGMGRDLYQREPVFRQEVDRCAELLKPQLGRDLRELLFPAPEGVAAASEALNETYLTQPALFVIEYALAKLWMAWGIRPEAMIGHSIGEYVAACLAEVFSLEDALALVATRGRLMQQAPHGSMLAVSMPEREIEALLGDTLALAAVNAPSLCVVSGPTEAIQALHERLKQQQVSCHLLHTSHAFHSPMMDQILEPFQQAVRTVRLSAPRIPYISNLTGDWISAAEATDPNYWASHLHHTVRFHQGLQRLMQKPDLILLEVGPGQTLGKLARQAQVASDQIMVLSSLPHAQDQHSDVEAAYTALGKLWLAGVKVDWAKTHAHEYRRRVPLPNYPFERQRHWLEVEAPSRNGSTSRKSSGRQKAIGDWLYAPFWHQSLPPSTLPPRNLDITEQCWLILIDEHGLGAQIVERLEQTGHVVVTVQAGARFAKQGDRSYTIDPRRAADYDRVLKELYQAGHPPHTITHLWSLTEEQPTPVSLEQADTAQGLGFYSLLFLAQAIGNRATTAPIQLAVVSNNLYNVVGTEALRPEKATLLGPCKVIPQEYAGVTCRCIDVLLPHADSPHAAKLADLLVQELSAVATAADVAYRGDRRWTQSFEPIELDSTLQRSQQLREGGVYLITGGLGGLGLTLAEHLAQTVHAKLVLLSRIGLPPRDTWQAWVAGHDAQDATTKKILRVQVLEQLGAEVLVLGADVAQPEEMRAAVVQILERFGALHGVLHLAGVPGGGLIQLKTTDLVESVFAAKVKGTLVLEQALGALPLDFMLLFSSITAVTGGLGQVDYCAANAFLDAYAHYRTQRGALTLTIDWDAWQWDTWQTASMAAMPEIQSRFKQLREQFGISFGEGLAVFDLLLGQPLPQVIVSTRDLHVTIADHQRFSQAFWRQESTKGTWSTLGGNGQSLSTRAYVAPRNEVEQIIADIWQQALGVEQIGIHDDFIELGGHSLLAIQVISRLRETFEIELPLRSIFEQNTVARLANTIMTAILEEVERMSQDEAQSQLTDEPVKDAV